MYNFVQASCHSMDSSNALSLRGCELEAPGADVGMVALLIQCRY